MTINYQRAAAYFAELLQRSSPDQLAARLRPKHAPLPPQVPHREAIDAATVDERWALLDVSTELRGQLLDPHTAAQMDAYAHNIEHFVGTVKVPVGIMGPLRVNGLFAQGDYYVPLATTEASLVASYSRGAQLIGAAGGASAALLNEGVSRAPVFAFDDIASAGRFVYWVVLQEPEIKAAANATTRHGRLEELDVTVEGSLVYLLLNYSTGDAAGQNMVTLATHAAFEWIMAHTPVTPRSAYLEGNLSGDKKASAQSLQRVRGRKVTAEVRLPAELVQEHLHTSTAQVADCARLGMIGGVLSGTIGVQAHYANGLAALFLATGQDVACVAEAAVGMSQFELEDDAALRASVTLPNMIVGSIGGGTGLPSQQAGLRLLGLDGPGNARALAEVAAGVCLAGELSLVGAIAANHFARAHAQLARGHDLKEGFSR